MVAHPPKDDSPIVWFDIDNTLYSASSRISDAMGKRIHEYFLNLGLSTTEASALHLKYYTEYGLAVRGLTRHHQIDPLDFDRKCDGSLPLEDMIVYSPKLCKLFEDIDRSKVRVWALTNAYKLHAERVLRILGLRDLVDGLVYCNYNVPNFSCKPEPEYYQSALKQAGVTDPTKCYFVDDSLKNVKAAVAQGWGHCVHFNEVGLEIMEGGRRKALIANGNVAHTGIKEIHNLEELRDVWPEIFTERKTAHN